jgi:hypothetical protein
LKKRIISGNSRKKKRKAKKRCETEFGGIAIFDGELSPDWL